MAAPAPAARRRVGPVASALVALVFAAAAAPVALLHTWWPATAFGAGEPAPVTVRARGEARELRGGHVVVARGQVLTRAEAQVARAAVARAPRGLGAHLAVGGALFVGALLASLGLARRPRGRRLRVQLALFGALLAILCAAKAALLASPLSSLAVPAALLAIWAAAALGRAAGVIAGLAAALVLGALSAFDPAALAVLAAQGVAPALALGARRPSRLRMLAAGGLGAAAAAGAYALVRALATGALPLSELARPLHSAWVAGAAAGLFAGALAAALWPLFAAALGAVSRRRLAALDDLGHPILQEIAAKAPGTWQHSLTMARLGERAAEAIGADARLVRVGAYFHDLGKTSSPRHYPENLGATEGSPHDKLAPEASAEAIVAHVNEGAALARRAGLPEAVIEFISTHHARGVLESFWQRADASAPDAFRYPGARPESPETAIVAIVDALEAVSRGLRAPDQRTIALLVQRIVYGKLHAGQLDDAGLTGADVRRIADALAEALATAHGLAGPGDSAAPPSLDVPLDSLDGVRPARRRAAPARDLDSVPTEDAAFAPTDAASPTGGATRSLRPERPAIEILADDDPRTARAARDENAAASDAARQGSLDEWESALDAAASLAPPITSPRPPPPPRKKPTTIPLDDAAADDSEVPSRRADTDGDLSPGVLVIGPPPATHPRPGTED